MIRQRGVALVCLSAVALLCAACKQESSQAQKSTPQPTSQAAHKSPEPAPTEVLPADPANDHASTPSWLPDADELPGWVRTSNTSVDFAGSWEISNPRLSKNIDAYRFKLATHCVYESVAPNPQGIQVRLTIFEAYDSDDAFGLFTSMAHAPDAQAIGSASADVLGSESDRAVWQNKYLIYAQVSGADDAAACTAVDRLLAGIAEPVPSSELPVVVNALPTAGRIEGQLWVARRHLNTLPDSVLNKVLWGKAVETTQMLGLSLDTLVAVAAYEVAPGEPPNVVWVVQYPTASDAQKAYTNYQSWRDKQRPAPLVSIEKPVGRYLCGSWTLDQESLRPIVPEIKSRLPKT